MNILHASIHQKRPSDVESDSWISLGRDESGDIPLSAGDIKDRPVSRMINSRVQAHAELAKIENLFLRLNLGMQLSSIISPKEQMVRRCQFIQRWQTQKPP